MLITKTRKVGHHLEVTLPENNGKTVPVGKEFLVSYQENGAIILIPKISDPFANVKKGELYEPDVWSDHSKW